jgi:hypothetical protein
LTVLHVLDCKRFGVLRRSKGFTGHLRIVGVLIFLGAFAL